MTLQGGATPTQQNFCVAIQTLYQGIKIWKPKLPRLPVRLLSTFLHYP